VLVTSNCLLHRGKGYLINYRYKKNNHIFIMNNHRKKKYTVTKNKLYTHILPEAH